MSRISHLSRHEADEFERQDVRKWDAHELVPVPPHDLRHVEPRQEGDRNDVLESKIIKKLQSNCYKPSS